MSDSSIISEGMFTLTHLVVLFNDQVIRSHVNKQAKYDTEEKMKIFLSVVSSLEVFLEVVSKEVLGNSRKFIIITIIQIVK
jgi:hypothetical protein